MRGSGAIGDARQKLLTGQSVVNAPRTHQPPAVHFFTLSTHAGRAFVPDRTWLTVWPLPGAPLPAGTPLRLVSGHQCCALTPLDHLPGGASAILPVIRAFAGERPSPSPARRRPRTPLRTTPRGDTGGQGPARRAAVRTCAGRTPFGGTAGVAYPGPAVHPVGWGP